MKDKSKFNSSIALLFRTHPEFGALVALVLIFVVFCFTATRFLSFESLAGILTVASELGIVAAGITFLMIRRPPRSTHCISSAASDVYKRQVHH